ncbi:MAG: transposase [Maribacter sp.]
MQGKKDYQEKLFAHFQLSDRVPDTNFYRRLKEVLDLDFLYPLTKGYYGDSGQKSIDPMVFFKLCLVGYLENIISDRNLIVHSSMRLDILYFIGYDIDEEYERNIARVESQQGRYMKGKRQSTVEPVFGTLTQFMGMRRINTIGLE